MTTPALPPRMENDLPPVALILKEPHLSRILDGSKVWEIRSSHTHRRGRIALARSGSGLLFGTVSITGSLGPLSFDELLDADGLPVEQRMDIRRSGCLPYQRKDGGSRTYAWVLSDPVLFETPRPYHHPQGAVIFVNLDTSS